MKVVTQMIHHFWERGALSAEQVKHLVRHGFVQAEDLAGFNGRAASEVQATEFELELDAIAEKLTRSATKRRGGKSRKRGRVVSLSGLGDRIRYEFDRRADWWPALIELARSFGPCETWEEAAASLRNVPARRFDRGLSRALRKRPSLLGDLWRAVDPEPFHTLIDEPLLGGPAVRAFRILLRSEETTLIGKYAWIVRSSEVACVNNLIRTHRRLLPALQRLDASADEGLTGALHHGVPDVLYWAFVTLYNARRRVSAGATPDLGRENGPLDVPGDALQRQAITWALLMNPPSLERILEMVDTQQPQFRPWFWRLATT